VSVAALISNSPGPIVTFALGNAHGIALDVKGSVYTWGANNWYQLIDGAQVNYPYMVRAIQNLPSGGAVQAGGDTTSYSYSGVGFAYAYVGGYMIPANTTREWGINRVWNSISVASAPFAFPASAFIFAVSQ
jgi:hypothetical protein